MASKQVIYDGFKAAVDEGIPTTAPGSSSTRSSAPPSSATHRRGGYITCVSTEKSGQDEFDFEYGDEFARHIEAVNPDVRRSTRLRRHAAQAARPVMTARSVSPKQMNATHANGTHGRSRKSGLRATT